MGFKIIYQGETSHRCTMPESEEYGLTVGAVVRCDCGKEWELARIGFFYDRWREIET